MSPYKRDYTDIRAKIKQSGNVCVYDITISGDGIGGGFSAGYFMSQLRLHIVNNTFHPFLFRYLCGSSIGAIIINFILKIWYLYETNETNDLALEFIDICYMFFSFDIIRQVMICVDENNNLELGNSYKLFGNALLTGGILTRDGIVRMLRCDTDVLRKFKPYFETNEYDEWLRVHLNNVFITVQSSETTISQIYTGNPNLFKTASKLIKFKQLTPNLFEHIILCSSGIMGVYEPLKIDGTEYSTDGSTIVANQTNVPQILHNFSYYNNVQNFFEPLLKYFEIVSGDFIIHNDVVNIQNNFETIPSFLSSPIKFVQTLTSLLTVNSRRQYASINNYELASIAYTQPIISDFSTSNANEIKGETYLYNQSILMMPENQAKVLNLKNSDIVVHELLSKEDFEINRCYQIDTYEKYCQNQEFYSSVVSRNPVSSYIYDARCFTHNNVRCHLVDTNTFVRHLYEFDTYYETIKMILNIAVDIENWTLCKNAGVIQSNVMYNIYLKRMNMKWDTGCDYNLSKIIQTSYNNFVGDGIYRSITDCDKTEN